MGTRELLVGDTPTSTAASVGLLVLRVVFGGALLLAHGLGKIPPPEGLIGMLTKLGMPAPGFLAWLSALAELVGGALLVIGLLTRPAALAIVINMVVAAFVVHADDPFKVRELAVLYGAAALALLIAGPGRYAVDAALTKRAYEHDRVR